MIRRILLALVLAGAAVAAFIVFYHPPMRLMPPPLLFRDPPEGLRVGEIALDDAIPVFYATSRLPIGAADNRSYTVAPDSSVHVGTARMRIGEAATLDQIRLWSTEDTDARPFIRLERLAEAGSFDPGADTALDAGMGSWLAEIDAALAESRHRDIIVYVHGANTTVERGLGQAAQLSHFSGRNAVVIAFVWPTAENFLRYLRDIRTAYGSAPKLASLLSLLAERTSARNIGVFTYSAGATLGSDALALLARSDPAAAARIGEVYHAAPDADFAGFVDDLAAYAPAAGRVTAAVNLGDSALRLAAAMNRGSRAGRPDIAELTPEAADFLLEAAEDQSLEVVQVHPEVMPGLPASSHTFWYDDPWVSSDALVTLLFHLAPAERGLVAERAATGPGYWTFPQDFPARMPGLQARLGDRLRAEVAESDPVPPAP